MENLEEYLESIKSYDERLSRACDCLNDLTYDIDDFVNEAESEQKEIEEKINDISDDEDSEEIKQLEIREDKLDELLNNIYDLQRSAKKACDCLGDLNYDFDNWNESVE